MALGYVLVEGMRAGTRIEGLPLTLRKVERYAVRDATPDQPSVWTTVEFDFPESEAGRLAETLADVLEEQGGWYSHFNVAGETFVVFAGRVFRYESGDEAARAEVEEYGRSVGVPEPQLDWDEQE